MAVLSAGIVPVAAQGPDPLACITCLVLELDAAEVEPLLAGEDNRSLGGVVIFVRAADGASARAAVLRLAAAGAEPGVILDPIAGASGDFEMRTAITSLRSASPPFPIAIDVERLRAAGVDPVRVAPYADATVSGGAVGGPWRRLADLERPSVATLAAASLTAGAERFVVHIRDVDPAVLRAFADLKLPGTEVRERRALTAAEIVARHQAQQRQQSGRIDTSIAEGTTTLMFEVPGMTAPVVITAATIVYRNGGAVEIEQRNIRVNGAAIGGGSADRRPQLPLLEPEQAATAPLTISLNDAYHYGRRPDDSSGAVSVEFRPLVPERALPSGTAWFDPRTFALRRIERRQTGLPAPIVASEQVEELTEYQSAEGPVWLPWRTRIYDVYEAAGHRTPVQRQLIVDRYLLNPPDFSERLAAAHASENVMLRQTPNGLRYLVRRADGDRAILADPSPPDRKSVV